MHNPDDKKAWSEPLGWNVWSAADCFALSAYDAAYEPAGKINEYGSLGNKICFVWFAILNQMQQQTGQGWYTGECTVTP